ncbi:MAG: IS200/IS605 family transposase [Phycisphaerae bacterium]|jgi:REP element-mobilizing transposase RayT
MAHTYCNLMYHVVFSTKHRHPLLDGEVMPQLTRVIGGIVAKRDGKLLAINGVEDHIHLLTVFPARLAVSELLRDIKAISSDWVHETFPSLQAFAWQTGYSAFSVSKSQADKVERYIAAQCEHHRRRTFEEELTELLERHGIEYDKRHLLD